MRSRLVLAACASSIALVALIALIALSAGCGFTEMHEVVLRGPTGPASGPVEVYMAGQAVTRPFYEVALLQAVGRGSEANGDDALKGLVTRGQALGCDAMVQVHVDEGYSIAHAAGVCVKYTRTGAEAAPQEPKAAPAPKPAPAPDAAPKSTPEEPEEDERPAGTPI